MYRRDGRYPSRAQNEEREEEEEEEQMVTYELDPLPRSFYEFNASQDANASAASSTPSSASAQKQQQQQQQQQNAGSASVLRSRGKRSRKESEVSTTYAAQVENAQQQQQQQQHEQPVQQSVAEQQGDIPVSHPLPLPPPLPRIQLAKRSRVVQSTTSNTAESEQKSKAELDRLMSLAMSVVAAATNNESSRSAAAAIRSTNQQQNLSTSTASASAAAAIAVGHNADATLLQSMSSATGGGYQLPRPIHRSTIPSPPRHSHPNLHDLSIVINSPQQRPVGGGGGGGGGGGEGPQRTTRTTTAASLSAAQLPKKGNVALQSANIPQLRQAADHMDKTSVPPPPPPPLPSTDRTRAWDIGDEFNQELMPKLRSDMTFPSKKRQQNSTTTSTRGGGPGGGGIGGVNRKATSVWGFPVLHTNPSSSFQKSAAPPPSHSLPVEALARKAAAAAVSSASTAAHFSSQSMKPMSRLGSRGPVESEKLIGVSQLIAIARPAVTSSSHSHPQQQQRNVSVNRGRDRTTFQASSVPLKSSQQVPSSTPQATSVSPDVTKKVPAEPLVDTGLPSARSARTTSTANVAASSSRKETFLGNESSTMKNLNRHNESTTTKGSAVLNQSVLSANEEKETEAVDDAVEEDDEDPSLHPLALRVAGLSKSSKKTMGVIEQANRSIAINTLASLLEPSAKAATAAATAEAALRQNPMQDAIATTTVSDIPSFLLDLLQDPHETNANAGNSEHPEPPSDIDTDTRKSAQFTHPSAAHFTPQVRDKKPVVLPLSEGHQWVSPSRTLDATAASSSSSSVAAARAKQKKISTSSSIPTQNQQPSLVAQLMDMRRKVDSELAMFTHSLSIGSSSSSILRNRGSVEVSLVSTDAFIRQNKYELIVLQAQVVKVTRGSDLLQDKSPDVKSALLPGLLILVAFSAAKVSMLGLLHNRKDITPKSKRIIIYAPFDVLRISSSSLSSSSSHLLLDSLTSSSSSSSSSTDINDKSVLLPSLLVTSTHFCELLSSSTL